MNKSEAKMRWVIKVETFTGWFSYACIAVAIGAAIFEIIQGRAMPPTLILRGLIIIPFGLWYGHRCLEKAKELKEELNHVKPGNTADN